MTKYFSLPFAVAGDKSVTPDALQPDGSVSYTEGFTPDYALPNSDPDYRPIPRAGYNGLMFDITEAIKQIQERSILTWRNDVEYTAGASVIGSDGFYYKASQASGPSTAPRDPVTQAAYWAGPSDIRKPPITVSDVGSMVALTGLAGGDIIKTRGYSVEGYGAATYFCRSGGGGTNDGFVNLNQTIGGGDFVLLDNSPNVMMAGARGDGITPDTAEFEAAAAAFPNGVIFCPKPPVSYVVNAGIVNPSTVFIFEGTAADLTGTATADELKAIFLGGDAVEFAGGKYIGGVPFADGKRTGKIEIVCGSIRQNAADRTKWDFIDDANHDPLGVIGAYATASGASITINFAKTYSKVLAMVVGPDETLANKFSLSVGASVGLSSAVINVGMLRGGAMTIYYDGANWQVASGTGADIVPVVTSYSNGTLKINHDYCRGVDIAVSPWSRNGAITNPYIPLIKNVGNNFFDLQWLDPTTGNIVTSVSPSTRMHALVRKSNNNGIFLDGTNDSDTLDLDDGNIWFFGIFEV